MGDGEGSVERKGVGRKGEEERSDEEEERRWLITDGRMKL
jgi:hypothetical protein